MQVEAQRHWKEDILIVYEALLLNFVMGYSEIGHASVAKGSLLEAPPPEDIIVNWCAVRGQSIYP